MHLPLYQLSAIDYQLAGSWYRQEFLPDPHLRVLRKENLCDEDLVRRKLAGRDGFTVFDSLLRVNHNCDGFFRDSVIVGPFGKDVSAGILQINFNPLIGRKVERHGTLRQICQRYFYSELTNLR